jgi:hypothetical protein
MDTAAAEREAIDLALDALEADPLANLPPMVARMIERDGLAVVDIADPVAVARIIRVLRRAPGTPA